MRNIKTIFVILTAIILLAACSSDTSTEPENGNNDNATTNASGQPMPALGDGSQPDGILATIQYAFDSGVPGVPPVELSMGYAQFGNMVGAGAVVVNDNQLSESNTSGQIFYMKPGIGSFESLSNVYFNGSNHSWTVSGSGDIPALSGSVQSVVSFSLTSPANNATVSKSQDLKVTWSGANNSDEKMMILLISIDNSNLVAEAQDLPNSGAYTISASKLSSLSGQAMLQVVKYRFKSVSQSGKTFYIISEVVRTATITVQ